LKTGAGRATLGAMSRTVLHVDIDAFYAQSKSTSRPCAASR
jgi:hypothetical protein